VVNISLPALFATGKKPLVTVEEEAGLLSSESLDYGSVDF
jgi:hypothetical protein